MQRQGPSPSTIPAVCPIPSQIHDLQFKTFNFILSKLHWGIFLWNNHADREALALSKEGGGPTRSKFKKYLTASDTDSGFLSFSSFPPKTDKQQLPYFHEDWRMIQTTDALTDPTTTKSTMADSMKTDPTPTKQTSKDPTTTDPTNFTTSPTWGFFVILLGPTCTLFGYIIKKSSGFAYLD